MMKLTQELHLCDKLLLQLYNYIPYYFPVINETQTCEGAPIIYYYCILLVIIKLLFN